MSSMLEQAVIDAAALKEVALKNAEATVVEKYSTEVKEAMKSLLEQDDDMDLDDMNTGLTMGDDLGAEEDSVVDNVPLAATDGEDLCPCPDEEQVIVLDFDDLARQMSDEGGLPDEMLDSEDVADEMLDDDEIDLEDEYLQENLMQMAELQEDEYDDDGDDLEEEVDMSEEYLDEIISTLEEKLTVDVDDALTGWAGRPQSDQKLAAEKILARMQDTEVKEEAELSKDATKEVDELMEAKTQLEEQVLNLTQQNTKLATAVAALKEHVEGVNATNAKFLYTNRVLTSDSLNERQRNKIVEAISNADSVEEAKVIFDTLQSAVGSTEKRQPKSLSEAVDRSSTHIMSSRNATRHESKVEPAVTRWQLLAGLKQK